MNKFMTKACQYCVLFFSSILLLCVGCATSPTTRTPQMQDYAADVHENRPVSTDKEIKRQNEHFAGNLPLGIGAKLDFFVADTAENAANFYKAVLRPLRSGKVFRDQAYEIDYAILPSKGDVFNHRNRTSEVSIRSDYKFRVGITRKFHRFSDFLTPDFWTTTDTANHAYPNLLVDQVPSFDIMPEEPKEHFDINDLPPIEYSDLLKNGKENQ